MNKFWIIFVIILLGTGEAIADIYLERGGYTIIADNDFSAEIERCKGIPQVGEAKFCMGKALVKYGRIDEAKDYLKAARDTFRANQKPGKAKEVEDWARNNNVPF